MRAGAAILGLLSDWDADWVVSVAERVTLPDDGVLIADRSRPGAVFVLLAGRLRVSAGSPPRTVAFLNPGEVLGEVSFIDGRPATATVSAVGPTTVLKLDADILRGELSRNEGFAGRFHRALAIFLAERLRLTLRGGDPGDGPDDRSEDLRAELADAEARGEELLARLGEPITATSHGR